MVVVVVVVAIISCRLGDLTCNNSCSTSSRIKRLGYGHKINQASAEERTREGHI